LKILRIIKQEWIQNGSSYCWTFWSLGLCAKGSRRESPHKLPIQIFKEHPQALRAWGKGPGSIATRHIPSTKWSAHTLTSPGRVAAGAARGAQYSPESGVVNALSFAGPGPLFQGVGPDCGPRGTASIRAGPRSLI